MDFIKVGKPILLFCFFLLMALVKVKTYGAGPFHAISYQNEKGQYCSEVTRQEIQNYGGFDKGPSNTLLNDYETRLGRIRQDLVNPNVTRRQGSWGQADQRGGQERAWTRQGSPFAGAKFGTQQSHYARFPDQLYTPAHFLSDLVFSEAARHQLGLDQCLNDSLKGLLDTHKNSSAEKSQNPFCKNLSESFMKGRVATDVDKTFREECCPTLREIFAKEKQDSGQITPFSIWSGILLLNYLRYIKSRTLNAECLRYDAFQGIKQTYLSQYPPGPEQEKKAWNLFNRTNSGFQKMTIPFESYKKCEDPKLRRAFQLAEPFFLQSTPMLSSQQLFETIGENYKGLIHSKNNRMFGIDDFKSTSFASDQEMMDRIKVCPGMRKAISEKLAEIIDVRGDMHRSLEKSVDFMNKHQERLAPLNLEQRKYLYNSDATTRVLDLAGFLETNGFLRIPVNEKPLTTCVRSQFEETIGGTAAEVGTLGLGGGGLVYKGLKTARWLSRGRKLAASSVAKRVGLGALLGGFSPMLIREIENACFLDADRSSSSLKLNLKKPTIQYRDTLKNLPSDIGAKPMFADAHFSSLYKRKSCDRFYTSLENDLGVSGCVRLVILNFFGIFSGTTLDLITTPEASPSAI